MPPLVQELPQAIVAGLLIGMVYALAAVGLSLIFGVMEIINFAYGEFLMVGMYVSFFAWSLLNIDPLLSIPFSVVAVVLLSLSTYRLLVRRIIRAPLYAQMLGTFGLGVFLQGSAQALFSPTARAVTSGLIVGASIQVGGLHIGLAQLSAGAGAAICLVALWLFLFRTEVGLMLRGASQDLEAAAAMGISPHFVHQVAWALSGAAIGIAGALLMNFFPVSPLAGIVWVTPAFVIVAMGGFGSLVGSAVAGLAMGVVQTTVGLAFPAYGVFAIFALYLVLVMVRPKGVFG